MEVKTVNGISEKAAEKIIGRLFVDGGNEVKRSKIIPGIISYKTFTNYNPALKEFGFTVAVHGGRSNRKKITALRLTDKGREVLNRQASLSLPVTPSATTTTKSTPSLLDEATRLTDEFNRQSQTWKWKLVREEVAGK